MILETALGSLLGLGGSIGTAAVEYFKTKQANSHELEMMRAQKELADAQHAFELDKASREGEVEAVKAAYGYMSAPTGTWVDALAASVRPSVTYAYFIAYAGLKVAYVASAWRAGQPMPLGMIWTGEDMVMFSTILSFWFGNRSLRQPGR